MTGSNGNKPWGQVREVEAGKMRFTRGMWAELHRELSLRLERTPASRALAVPFADVVAARRAHWGLWSHFRRGEVRITKRINPDGTVTLYVRRGPSYGKG